MDLENITKNTIFSKYIRKYYKTKTYKNNILLKGFRKIQKIVYF